MPIVGKYYSCSCSISVVASFLISLFVVCTPSPSKVVVEDLSSKTTRTFPCHQWLDESEGDCRTERILEAGGDDSSAEKGTNSTYHFEDQELENCVRRPFSSTYSAAIMQFDSSSLSDLCKSSRFQIRLQYLSKPCQTFDRLKFSSKPCLSESLE